MKTNIALLLVVSLHVLALPGRAQSVGPGKVDLTFNTQPTAFSGPNSVVRTIVPLTNGQVLVGGDFSSFTPGPSGPLVKRNSDGSPVDSFVPGLLRRIGVILGTAGVAVHQVLPRPDGKFYIHGNFESVRGVSGLTNLAVIDAEGVLDTNFVPTGLASDLADARMAVEPDGRLLVNLYSNLVQRVGLDGVVEANLLVQGLQSIRQLAVHTDGKIHVTGALAANPFVAGLVRLMPDGAPDGSFTPPAFELTPGVPTQPFAFGPIVLQPNGRLLVLGFFTRVGGVQRGGIARLNLDGSLDTTFVPGANGIGTIYQGELIGLHKISLLPDGRMIVSRDGAFRYNNTFMEGVARLSATGILDTGFDPGTGPVDFFGDRWFGIQTSAVGPNGEVYVGGIFTNFNATGRKFIVRLNSGPASSKPAIVSPPESQSVSNGVDVTFTVEASGPGPFGFVWKHNGKIIPGATNASLTVSNVQLANVGAYIVTVANSAGATVAMPAILTVNGVSVPDLTRPGFTVTSPRGTFVRAFSNEFTFSGTSRDNLGLGAICYQQDTNPWVPVVLTSNWTFTVTLHPGTNLFRVKVSDIAGNHSATQKVAVFYVVTQALDLKITGTGAGMVTGATNTQGLEIGRNYRLLAVPKAGNLFSNWIVSTDLYSRVVTNAALSLFMWSNAVVCANFVTNPFIALGGTYQGIFEEAPFPAHESSGFISFLLSTRGSYSGQLHLGGAVHPLSGSFGLDLTSTKVIPRRGTTDVTVHLSLSDATDAFSGLVTNVLFKSVLAGFHTLPPASNFVGRSTAAIALDIDPGDTPPAPGFATWSVARSGIVAFTGRLSDDTPFTQSVRTRSNGDFVVYPALYRGKGSLPGSFVHVDSVFPPAYPYAFMFWTKLPGAPGVFYTNGFGGMRLAIGSPYLAPTRGAAALTETNLLLTLSDGSLTEALVIPVSLAPNHRFTVNATNTHRLTLTVTPTTGAVSGSFLHPVTGRVAPIKAVLLQNQDAGAGYFVSTNGTGAVLLGSPELE